MAHTENWIPLLRKSIFNGRGDFPEECGWVDVVQKSVCGEHWMPAGRWAEFGLVMVVPSGRVCHSRLFLVLVLFWRLLGDEDCFCGCRWFFFAVSWSDLRGWWEMCVIQTCFSREWLKPGTWLNFLWGMVSWYFWSAVTIFAVSLSPFSAWVCSCVCFFLFLSLFNFYFRLMPHDCCLA